MDEVHIFINWKIFLVNFAHNYWSRSLHSSRPHEPVYSRVHMSPYWLTVRQLALLLVQKWDHTWKLKAEWSNLCCRLVRKQAVAAGSSFMLNKVKLLLLRAYAKSRARGTKPKVQVCRLAGWGSLWRNSGDRRWGQSLRYELGLILESYREHHLNAVAIRKDTMATWKLAAFVWWM